MSHIETPSPSPSFGRGTPRWSVGGHWASSPASDGGAAWQQGMRPGGTTVILQRAEKWIGIGHRAVGRVKAAGIIGGDVVTAVSDWVTITVTPRKAIGNDAVGDGQSAVIN